MSQNVQCNNALISCVLNLYNDLNVKENRSWFHGGCEITSWLGTLTSWKYADSDNKKHDFVCVCVCVRVCVCVCVCVIKTFINTLTL